jgi:hypothetical protein
VLDSRAGGVAGGARLPASGEVGVSGGGGAVVGAGARLGPGDLFVDARLDVAPLRNRTSGDVVAGGLFLAAGYRFIF